jgi:hypothetical protein
MRFGSEGKDYLPACGPGWDEPGEILALRWSKIESQMIEVAQRVYRGLPDDPKTERGKRQAALPPDLARDLAAWREISSNTAPDALD